MEEKWKQLMLKQLMLHQLMLRYSATAQLYGKCIEKGSRQLLDKIYGIKLLNKFAG